MRLSAYVPLRARLVLMPPQDGVDPQSDMVRYKHGELYGTATTAVQRTN
jgi:hypothetical protein